MSEYTEYIRSRVRVVCDGCGLVSLSETRDGYFPSYEYANQLAECGWHGGRPDPQAHRQGDARV